MPSERTVNTVNEGSEDGPASLRAGTRAAPHLFLALECGRLNAAGARYALADIDEVIIGRGVAREASRVTLAGGVRQLIVRVPDRWMSASHARIVRDRATSWTLEDAQSTNGSLVNGERITESTPLSSDDVIELGHTIFFVREELAGPDFDGPGGLLGMRTLVPAFAAQLEAVERVATTGISVLLLGETGTGKEVIARAIHTLSARQGAFVGVNCGALPELLLESQLFGHVKGAFSGAVRDALGFVRSAEGGTLFLDEIGDLSLRSQAALLRVLQEREVVPVGATRPIKVDIRVLAATHRPLDVLSARGEFRSDLFARLAGLRVVLPPLRERREDLGLLIADVLRAVAPGRESALTLGASAGRAFAFYDWPLNIRELSQALALGVALTTDDTIDLAQLPPALAAARASHAPPSQPPGPLTSDDERLRAELVAHLEVTGGNVSEVARAMSKQRTQIHRWVRRFGIDLTGFRR